MAKNSIFSMKEIRCILLLGADPPVFLLNIVSLQQSEPPETVFSHRTQAREISI